VPESGPERRVFAPAWGWVAEAEAGPEVGNLAAGAGEPGQGPACGAGIQGAGGVAENPESGPSRVDGERQLPADSVEKL
jgi:hypothetical protein